ncbi:sensor protein BceS [Jeotgalicoccus coquinae]|uniref:histidine kinase n=1 Tax=Jeotgalicoccus coquinae TaxID=709509 RepID=A0A6V7R7L4_9STAP|nr:sensor histidine kinase [Jeotgalicoccus coquinae]MBB6423166.1 OmpR family two-component system bacitracin resistance sensor histidine kinase BceS [Jeotgalicoccus coquinae]GGE10098.1 sensor protein BceS [Jeotgalicoccus coquinae]CAD2073371.1 Sensor histidine kinase GraS [Jeotgalicoccus coquinae]
MYIKENIPVFLLFSVFNLVILLIGFIDNSIPNIAVLYIFIFNLLIFIIYIVWDLIRRKQFTSDLAHLESLDDVVGMSSGSTPEQRMIYDKLDELRRTHQNELDRESQRTRENLDELTRFIHDMKMPVTTMKLMIDDLDGEPKTKLGAEWSRLNSMLNEVLYLKRLPNIKNDLYIEEINLAELLNISIKKLRDICMQKNIGFDIELSEPLVHTDRKWMQFVLDQIITNSVKYSRNNDIVINGNIINDQAQLTITDYGRGIKQKDINRIFESGFTSTSDHDDAQSTGMGLYLTKEVCDVLGINIEAASQYGEYTTVTLTFNLANEFTRITMK